MRQLYHAIVPYEHRFLFYKLRHLKQFRKLRQKVNPSSKGDFSLRSFDRFGCLFIHITKSGGTSVAKSLFGELPYHYTAKQYRVIFGRRDFYRYFKFAFVRNPWDRLFSAYSYLCNGGWDENDQAWYNKYLSHIPDFNSFVLDWLCEKNLRSHLHLRPQSDFICDRKGYPLLDWLGYFETLDEDFAKVAQKIGIDATLSHVNASARTRDYRDIYTPDSIAKVARLYRQDIENLGYVFDGLNTRMTISSGKFEAL